MFDGSCFDGSLYLSMQFDLDRAELGKADTAVMGQGKASCLGIGEGIVAVPALKARIARFLTTLDTSEKCIEGFLQTQEHVLKHLGIHVLVFFPDFCLDLWQVPLLLVVADGLKSVLVGIF